jgi:hypothetical protein
MAPYLGYWWAVPILILAGARWKQLSLALMRVLAVLGPTDRIRRYAFEVIRLERSDAPDIPSYLQDATPKTPIGARARSGKGTTRAIKP